MKQQDWNKQKVVFSYIDINSWTVGLIATEEFQMPTKNRFKKRSDNLGLWMTKIHGPEQISGQTQYGGFNTLLISFY